MVDKMIDIYHSRRGRFHLCEYYLRDEKNTEIEKLINKKKPFGIFYAKPINPETNQAGEMGNVLMFDVNLQMIETEDETPELKKNCIVIYKNETWIVDNVQRIPHIKESEFSNEEHFTSIISLRR